jgi:hypothetical protein
LAAFSLKDWYLGASAGSPQERSALSEIIFAPRGGVANSHRTAIAEKRSFIKLMVICEA